MDNERKKGRLIIQYNTVGNIYIQFFVMIFRKAQPFVCRVLHTNDEVKLNEGQRSRYYNNVSK